jgi:hypothetical protein
MTTLVPKFDRMDGGSTPTGAINRPFNERLQETVSVMDFIPSGTSTSTVDCTAYIQAAINSIKTTGGTVFFPVGTYLVNTTIDLNDVRNITLLGQSTLASSPKASVIKLAATSGSRIVDGRSAQGLCFEKLNFQQTSTAFTAYIFDFSHSTAFDAAYITFRDCQFTSAANATTIDFSQTILSSVQNCMFYGGHRSISCHTGYGTTLSILNTTFQNAKLAPIYIWAPFFQVLTIQNCTFEPLSDGSAGAFLSEGEIQALTYTGNYHGDANTSGTWITINAALYGATIHNNFIGSGDVGIYMVNTTSAPQGVSIAHNQFSTINHGIDISGVTNGVYGDIYGNVMYLVTTPLIGAPKIGQYQALSTDAVSYKGTHIFDNTVTNGVGGVISGSIWSVYTGNNVGITVQGVTSGNELIIGKDTTQTVFKVLSNGNVQNLNNSYAAISDIKLKENIADATPKLDALNQVRIVNYGLKGDVTKAKLIGVVAQELESIFPGLIEETRDIEFDEDNNEIDLGTTTKSVKYSVFVPILIKAVQELSKKVTDLEEQVIALGTK